MMLTVAAKTTMTLTIRAGHSHLTNILDGLNFIGEFLERFQSDDNDKRDNKNNGNKSVNYLYFFQY